MSETTTAGRAVMGPMRIRAVLAEHQPAVLDRYDTALDQTWRACVAVNAVGPLQEFLKQWGDVARNLQGVASRRGGAT